VVNQAGDTLEIASLYEGSGINVSAKPGPGRRFAAQGATEQVVNPVVWVDQ